MFATNGTSFFVQAKYDGWREAVVTDVCFWHIADNPIAPAFVRFWGTADNSGFWPVMAWSLMTHMRHLASRYSTASAAIASTPDGMVRPSAFAVMVQSGP